MKAAHPPHTGNRDPLMAKGLLFQGVAELSSGVPEAPSTLRRAATLAEGLSALPVVWQARALLGALVAGTAPEESEPVAYMVSRIQAGKPIEGLTGIDINVKVIRIIDLAKESIKTGREVSVGD